MFKNILITCLSVIIFIAPTIYSGTSDRTLLYLNIINSPRAVGMGGASVNLVDAQSALYNPGAYGLFSLNSNFSFSLPNSTKWLPQLADDLLLKTWSIGGGYSKTHSNNFRYSIGLAYSKRIFDYGVYSITDPDGNRLPPFNPIDKADYFTIAIGIEYKIRIGIGYTLKKYYSDDQLIFVGDPLPSTETTGDTYDFGLLLEYDLFQTADLYDNDMHLEVTPSFALVKLNLGDPLVTSAFRQTGYVARLQRTGFGLNISLKQNSKHIMKIKIVYEKEKDLVDNNYYFSETGASEIIPKINRRGIEIGIFDAIYFRTGELKDENSQPIIGVNTSDYFYSSNGFGFSLRGLLTAFSNGSTDNKVRDAMGYILKNIDVKFDWAKISENSSPLNKTKFMKLSITI